MSLRTLTAFYDLQLATVSFDVIAFIALAQISAVQQDCSTIHVVFVPGPNDGFRDDDVSYPVSEKIRRLHAILVPCCALLDATVTMTVCSHRREAEDITATAHGPVFPEGYAVSKPRAEFLISGVTTAAVLGETIPSLRASDYAKDFAGRWLEEHSDGKRPVVITLREAQHASVRNSNVDAWIKFARHLKADGYFPVFVRDTQMAVQKIPPAFTGLTICEFAPIDIDLRLALYELAYLNLFVPNGPGQLCWFDRNVRFLMFKLIVEDVEATSSVYHTSMGFELGGQFSFATRYQRLVWEPDDLDVIQREFDAMVERIGDDDARDQPPSPDPQNAEDPMEVALRLQMTGRFEEATAIYQDIVGKDPDNADAWHLLGVIAHQADRPEAAEKMILRAISLTGGQSNYFINLAAVLKKAERLDEAANCLWRAVAFAPNDAGAHADLAEVLAATSEGDKAKSAMLKALKLKPDSIDICERAGQLFHAAGDIEIAANLYRQALEFRDDAVQRRLKAKEHLPEIPVQTLKTA